MEQFLNLEFTNIDSSKMLYDYPISEEEKEKYKNYRKVLRDITEQPRFPYEVSWPTLE